MPNKTTDKLSKKILENIQNAEPKSKNYFVLKDFLFGLGLTALLLVSIFSFAAFLFDYYEIKELHNSDKLLPWEVVRELLFELVLVTVASAGLIYIIYRQTDWMMVKHRAIISLTIAMTIIGGGGLLYVFAEETNNEDLLINAKKPVEIFRPKRQENILKRLEEENIFAGRIVEVKTTTENAQIISISNVKETKDFVITNQTKLPPKESLQRGEKVIVKFSEKDGKLYAEWIKPIQVGKEFMKNKLPNPGQVQGMREKIMEEIKPQYK